jgi:hypothetical protein
MKHLTEYWISADRDYDLDGEEPDDLDEGEQETVLLFPAIPGAI